VGVSWMIATFMLWQPVPAQSVLPAVCEASALLCIAFMGKDVVMWHPACVQLPFQLLWPMVVSAGAGWQLLQPVGPPWIDWTLSVVWHSVHACTVGAMPVSVMVPVVTVAVCAPAPWDAGGPFRWQPAAATQFNVGEETIDPSWQMPHPWLLTPGMWLWIAATSVPYAWHADEMQFAVAPEEALCAVPAARCCCRAVLYSVPVPWQLVWSQVKSPLRASPAAVGWQLAQLVCCVIFCRSIWLLPVPELPWHSVQECEPYGVPLMVMTPAVTVAMWLECVGGLVGYDGGSPPRWRSRWSAPRRSCRHGRCHIRCPCGPTRSHGSQPGPGRPRGSRRRHSSSLRREHCGSR